MKNDQNKRREEAKSDESNIMGETKKSQNDRYKRKKRNQRNKRRKKELRNEYGKKIR